MRRRAEKLNDVGLKVLRRSETAAAFADGAEDLPVAGKAELTVEALERLLEHGIASEYINNFI